MFADCEANGGELLRVGKVALFGDEEVLDGGVVEEVGLDDAFEVFGGAGVIPDAVRIDDRDGPIDANTKAVGFCSMNQLVGVGEIEFFEAGFEELPGGGPGFGPAAFGLGRGGAEEEVALVGGEFEFGGDVGEGVGHDSPLRSRFFCSSWQACLKQPDSEGAEMH